MNRGLLYTHHLAARVLDFYRPLAFVLKQTLPTICMSCQIRVQGGDVNTKMETDGKSVENLNKIILLLQYDV